VESNCIFARPNDPHKLIRLTNEAVLRAFFVQTWAGNPQDVVQWNNPQGRPAYKVGYFRFMNVKISVTDSKHAE
jgi:hypothetical protein